jgi:hypothetical protein
MGASCTSLYQKASTPISFARLRNTVIGHGGHDNDLDFRIGRLDPCRGVQAAGAVLHHHVHQHKVDLSSGAVSICDLGRVHRRRKLIAMGSSDKTLKQLS